MRPQTTRSVGMEPNHELEFTCGVRPVREALELLGLTHRRAAKVASETAQNTSATSRVRVLGNHHHV